MFYCEFSHFIYSKESIGVKQVLLVTNEIWLCAHLDDGKM